MLKALGGNGINAAAIHNHMTTGQATIYFLRYWGRGPVDKLASGFRAALGQLAKQSPATVTNGGRLYDRKSDWGSTRMVRRSFTGTLAGTTCALILWTSNASGQAGPPFRSDEPDTPGNGNWEINIAGIGARNPGEGRYALPNLDLNYGLGDRIQLKYEMAYGIEEVRGSTPSVAGGIGNSLAGVKYRFFEKRASQTGETNFALSVYPQLLFSAVHSSVRRNIADPGQFYLPFECSGRVGQVTFSGELGHWFARHQVPGTWVEAAVLGHDFSKESGLYAEIYRTTAIQYGDSRRVPDFTLGVGGRKSIKKDGSVRLLAMLGHSLLAPEPTGTRPQWIAYIGLRILIEKNKSD